MKSEILNVVDEKRENCLLVDTVTDLHRVLKKFSRFLSTTFKVELPGDS